MTRDELVDDVIEQAKKSSTAYWAALPDEERLRLSGMEGELERVGDSLSRGCGACPARAPQALCLDLELPEVIARWTPPGSEQAAVLSSQKCNALLRGLALEQQGVSANTGLPFIAASRNDGHYALVMPAESASLRTAVPYTSSRPTTRRP